MDNNQPDNDGNKRFWDMVEGNQFLKSFFSPLKAQLDAWTKEQREAFLQAMMNAGKPK